MLHEIVALSCVKVVKCTVLTLFFCNVIHLLAGLFGSWLTFSFNNDFKIRLGKWVGKIFLEQMRQKKWTLYSADLILD